MAEASVSPELYTSPESPSGLSKSDSFMFETKYVVLNFMSLVPPELYSGHLSSPGTPMSDLSVNGQACSNRFFKAANRNAIKKARSLDVSPRPFRPKLKYLGKLVSMRENDSPASEDNVSYRYKRNSEHIPYDCDSPKLGLDTTDAAQSFSAPDIHGTSGSISPRKTPSSLYRMQSDISSSGDFSSYNSDADDEYDDFSNASSIFSMNSARLRKGFLDLRSVPVSNRLSTVASQSDTGEAVDQCDSPVNLYRDTPDNGILESQMLETQSSGKGSSPENNRDEVCESVDVDETDHIDGEDDGLDCLPDFIVSDYVRRKSGDRSKLKLDIPCVTDCVQMDDILVSLQSEINSEISELESEFEDALKSVRAEMKYSPRRTPLTPQTEAARMLARIGDEVKDQYASQISDALKNALMYNLKEITYQQYKDLAKVVVDESLPGWRQVALLMVFAQKMVWKSVECGQKQLNTLLDYSSRLVAEVAAEFIIKQGGWNSVMNFDPSQSSDTQSETSPDSSGKVADYFSGHDITQVESGTHTISTLQSSPESPSQQVGTHDVGKLASYNPHHGDSVGFMVASSNSEGTDDLDSSRELRDLISPETPTDVFTVLTPDNQNSGDNQNTVTSEDRQPESQDFDTLAPAPDNCSYDSEGFVEGEDVAEDAVGPLSEVIPDSLVSSEGQAGDNSSGQGVMSAVRQTGWKLAVVSLAVLVLGIGIRVTVFNR